MALMTSYASVHDNDPRERDITYYWVFKDIIEISFNEGRKKIVPFERDWADNNKNKTDKHGFTLVYFTRPNKKTCPFILSSLVLQESSCRIYWVSLGWCPSSQNQEIPLI